MSEVSSEMYLIILLFTEERLCPCKGRGEGCGVVGVSPCFRLFSYLCGPPGSCRSGQTGLTVNQVALAYGGSNPPLPTRGSSSAGRASAFQAEGRGFESRLPLRSKPVPISSSPSQNPLRAAKAARFCFTLGCSGTKSIPTIASLS
jgi:hypothetical protein